MNYLFFDTETTGLPFNYEAPSSFLSNWPRMVQLSWILADADYNVLSTHNHIIYPQGFFIPWAAARIHGITNQVAREYGEDLRTVLDWFLEDFQSATYLVGHNISFDQKVVGAELIRIGKHDVMFTKPAICTMLASTDYCAIPSNSFGYKWPKLQELYTILFGHGFNDAHNSMNDVAATMECFIALQQIGII